MGKLTKMEWPTTSLLELLEEAQTKTSDADLAHLTLKNGKGYLVTVIHGNPDAVNQIHDLLLKLLDESSRDRLANWCMAMKRPKTECGCPDCGSSICQV